MRIEIADLPERIQKQILRKLNEQTIRENEKKRKSAVPVSPHRSDGEAKGNKLHAEKTDGYASKKEAKRAAELRLMEQAGEISDLHEQVRYELLPPYRDKNGKVIERGVDYVADFCYVVTATGERVVEDVKGYRNPSSAPYRVFVLKRKMMLHRYGISVREV